MFPINAVQAKIRQEGAICVQAKKLFEIVRSLPEADERIKLGANDHVGIVCDRSRFKMPGLTKDNFPEIKDFVTGILGESPPNLSEFLSVERSSPLQPKESGIPLMARR